MDRRTAQARRAINPNHKGKLQRAAVAEQNHMLVSCPGCRRIFGKPLVMLDFSGEKGRLMNVCPYCGRVLGCADEGKRESDVRVLGVEEKHLMEKGK